MNTYVILHNPRCAKSRFALKYLQDVEADFEVIEYQKGFLSVGQIQKLQNLLGGVSVLEFTRRSEKEFSDLNLEKKSENDVIKAMVQYPNLMQRPIIVKNNTQAVIARDEQTLKNFIL